ncbi:MAG: O-acetyl-ADP-ribose deacetylase [Chloroflexi bacterium]|nr:O-acetyl-ADP-ribose deacetylase [Chloroflexota bacterium]
MEATVNRTVIRLVQGDITRQATDAIVNAANSGLMGGGGVDGAIHRAGGPAILEECRRIRDEIGRLPAGKAIITTGGNLKAKYVIHTVGPVWHGGTKQEAETLASAHIESLKLAAEKGLRSVSFPAISTGAYGYPAELAAKVALQAAVDFVGVNTNLKEVNFVLFDSPTYRIYADMFSQITQKSN